MHSRAPACVCVVVILVLATGVRAHATSASAQPGSRLLQHTPAQHSRKLLQKKYVLSPDPDHKNCYMYRASDGDSVPAIAKALGVSESELKSRNSANIQDFSRLNGRFLQICNIKNFENAEGPGGAPLTGAASKPLSAAAPTPAPAPAPAPAPKAAPAPAAGPAPASAPAQASGPGIGLPFGVRPGGLTTPLGGFGLGRRRK